MDANTASKINIKFNKRRAEREDKIRHRREDIYSRLPGVREIDDAVLGLAYKMFSEAGQGEEPEHVVEKFQAELTSLFEKKKGLLLSAGLPTDYLEPAPVCEKCADTGSVDGELCSCYKSFVINELYDNSNLGEILKRQTFDAFDIKKYSDRASDGMLSPRQNMVSILNECRDFVKTFGTGKNLLFYGAPGLGKTFLSSSIANELIGQGMSVLYQSAGSIMSVLEDLKFGRTAGGTVMMSDRLYDAELLIIDDLGTEFSTAFTASEAFKIVNSRILGGKSTVISTNLSLNDLRKAYSERFLSRVIGHYKQLKFYGDDIRTLEYKRNITG